MRSPPASFFRRCGWRRECGAPLPCPGLTLPLAWRYPATGGFRGMSRHAGAVTIEEVVDVFAAVDVWHERLHSKPRKLGEERAT